MIKKAIYSVGILNVHDIEKKEAFLAYRRKHIPDYDKRYENLDKLFLSKDLFAGYARKDSLDIIFTETDLKGYWNDDFVFNVFLYKRQ